MDATFELFNRLIGKKFLLGYLSNSFFPGGCGYTLYSILWLENCVECRATDFFKGLSVSGIIIRFKSEVDTALQRITARKSTLLSEEYHAQAGRLLHVSGRHSDANQIKMCLLQLCCNSGFSIMNTTFLQKRGTIILGTGIIMRSSRRWSIIVSFKTTYLNQVGSFSSLGCKNTFEATCQSSSINSQTTHE